MPTVVDPYPQPAAGGHPLRILVLDGTAAAVEAFAQTRASPYDFVLLDRPLPGVNPLAVLAAVRRAGYHGPLLILGGDGDGTGPDPQHLCERERDPDAERELARAVAAREARFRSALNIDTVGVLFFSMDGEITDANDAFLQMTGYSRFDAEAGLLRWDDLIPPEWTGHIERTLDDLRTTGRTRPCERELVRKDGSRTWALCAAARLDAREAVEFVLDIGEHKQADAEQERLLALERRARADAERAARTRDDVLAIVAHDLRSPVQAIVSAATMLHLQAEDDRQKRHIGVILRSARDVERLLSDLLDVARIEAGTFSVRPTRVDVSDVVQDIAERAASDAGSRGVRVTADVARGLPAVNADPTRLRQVLANLVGNAVKFATAGSGVTVSVRRLSACLQISVIDTGPGIPESDLPYVFDRFWQADRASRSGAGLGLAICKGIVEAHGGRIWVESVVGAGTTCHFTIPLADG